MKNWFIFAIVYLSALQVLAQPVSDDPARPTIGQTGQLFTIRWTPKSQRIEVGLAGKSAATIDPEKVVLFGKVYPAKGQPRALRVEPAEGHFQVVEKIEPNSAIEIEIKEKETLKSEKFKIPAKP